MNVGPTSARTDSDTRNTPTLVRYRNATPADGRVVHQLAQEAGGLEVNPEYAYLLLCDHFSATTLVAESEGVLTGFVAAFILPDREDTLFVWQIGVHPGARGLGIASSLLDALAARDACARVRFIEATASPSNVASGRLFESFARRHDAASAWSTGYPSGLFRGPHEPEDLIRVGPLPATHSTSSTAATA